MNFLFTDFRFPRFGCVYRITCIATNRSYVGKTQCLDTRIRLHRNLLIRGGHYSPMMQQDFRTYGIETFQVEVIERKLGLGAAKLECYWMGRFNSVDNGYNTRVGQTDTSTNKRTPSPAQKAWADAHRGICETHGTPAMPVSMVSPDGVRIDFPSKGQASMRIYGDRKGLSHAMRRGLTAFKGWTIPL